MNPILATFMQALASDYMNNVRLDSDALLLFDCNINLPCRNCPYDPNCSNDNRFTLQDLITQHHPELLI